MPLNEVIEFKQREFDVSCSVFVVLWQSYEEISSTA